MKKIELKNKGKPAFIAVILTGVFLRLFMLGSGGISPDEYMTAKIVSEGNLLRVFFDAMANTSSQPLFYIIERIFVSVFGISETALRIFPVILGILNIFIVYRLTRSFFSSGVSILVTGVFALNPLQVYYSQQAAVYVLFETASLLMIYYFLISIKYNHFTAAPFIFWSVAALYTHDGAVLLLLILNVLLLIKYREEIRVSNWIKAQAVIFILWLPVFLSFLKNFMRMGGEIKPSGAAVFYSLKNFLFGPFVPMNGWIIAALTAAVFLVLMACVTRGKIHEKKSMDILVSIGFLAIVTMFISALAAGTIYSDRSIIYAGYIAILLLCAGLSYLYKEAMAVFIAVLLLIYAASYKTYYSEGRYPEGPHKNIFQKVRQERAENDIILHAHGSSYGAFRYYSSIREKTGFRNMLIGKEPAWEQGRVNTFVRKIWIKVNGVLDEKAGINVYAGQDRNVIPTEKAGNILKSEKRIWLVAPTAKGIKKILSHEPAGLKNYEPVFISPAKTEWIKRYFIVEEEHNFDGVDLFLLRKK